MPSLTISMARKPYLPLYRRAYTRLPVEESPLLIESESVPMHEFSHACSDEPSRSSLSSSSSPSEWNGSEKVSLSICSASQWVSNDDATSCGLDRCGVGGE